MAVVTGVSILISCFLLLLYLRIKRDIRSMHQQVHYQNETSSAFRNYSLTNDRDLRELRKDIQLLHDLHAKEQEKRIQSDQQLKEMITNISHDLRTPLTSIAGYLQLLETCEDPEAIKRYCRVMQERVNYLKELLEELFLYTKVTNEGFGMQMERIRPCSLLSQLLLSYYQAFQRKHLDMDISFANEECEVFSDSYYMERIFTNLLSNMLKHSQGSCCIIQRIEADHMIFTFSNDVLQPLTSEQLAHMFQRFYTQSSGMEQHMGSVYAEADGTRLDLSITFPLPESMCATEKAQA